ncbi:MAG: hypothetical protein LBL96_05065 [Clostridiales bacterium]|jgi:hypothetical protein|nr:hypothetical protein [Clostridiales bacterium]
MTFFGDITAQQVIGAALGALVITWLINKIASVLKFWSGQAIEMGFPIKDMSAVLQRCCAMFPHEIVIFGEKTFQRGMKVRVTTDKQRVYEGRIIGLNNEDMLCLLSNNYIVAHQLDRIKNIIACAETHVDINA